MKFDSASEPTQTIGLVLDFFNPKILEGAYAYFEQHGIRLDARWSVRGDWTPKKPGWDGVIYSVVDNAELHARIQQWRMPKVSLTAETEDACVVIPDYIQCGVLAAKELVDAGAAGLMNITASTREIDTQFTHGVSMYAQSQSIPFHSFITKTSSLRKMQRFLLTQMQSLPLPLGFCQPHAGIAYSLQPILLESGLRIPEDVPMVVIDKDVQLTPSLATVPMTTVELDEWHRGFVAAEMLHRLLIDDPLPQKQIIIPPKGITHRASTGHEVIKDQVVATTLGFVRDHFLEPISVSDVVAAVGMSRRVVEMRFRETFNRGIHEELTRLRIEEAKCQIIHNDSSITRIAENCGFSSIHYFSAAFKRETGVSPKQYHKKESSL